MATEEAAAGVHVLMVAFSSQGHINPMLRLGKRLASKGLHVTLASTEIARHRMLKAIANNSTTASSNSNNVEATDGTTTIRLEFFSDGFSLDYDRGKDVDHYMDCLAKFGPENLSNLIDNLSSTNGQKFSCVINNPFVPWVADVAARHNIPCAMFWIQPISLYAIYYRFYNEMNPFPTLTNPDMSVRLPGLPSLQTEDLPSFVLPSNPFGSFPKMFRELFRNLKKVKWVLGNSFYELEKDVIESMELYPIRPIGPLVPSALLGEGDGEQRDIGFEMWAAEELCIEWLDKKPPSSVVYVSFGSIVVLSAKQMENIAMALKKSNRPFLWVVKQPEHAVSDGTGQLPPGFLEETEGRGLVVSWSPQTRVLAHPAVACFISHCGWNSMLETVVAGVPVIALPQWTDQPTNAKLMVDVFQMGLRLRPDQDGVVSKEEVEMCIEEITSGPRSEELKKKAAQWKEEARKAVAQGGSSDRNIQLFVDEIVGKYSTSSPTQGDIKTEEDVMQCVEEK
ncbi:PREDICTED: UDP-glycosyltransferase 84B2-like [Nelumbo nucifera]|uniref:Glycosyltransferase n=2 Tax=Nelumbo nucifera TaxID=4432 RepID=A0A822XR23_NELNU|nr:PREDICTED: UDP-glycosyltransferase 84B2-like [Nelumbo nucifera]DAD21416.1 TPA_asm: hypothetical protein HUJ06_022879 [Nelumbo nucifera]